MPRYAMMKPFSEWDVTLETAQIEEFGNDRSLFLDSMIINESDLKVLKKSKKTLVCPVCGKEVYFVRAHRRKGKDYNPFWRHKGGDDGCGERVPESPAHAQAKRFIFNTLKAKGYKVYEEKRHQIGGQIVRADVAVLQEIENGEVWKLAVEVQASEAQIDTAKRRIAAYFNEKVPVAWVFLLDHYFALPDDEDEYERYNRPVGYAFQTTGPIEPDQEYVFATQEGGKTKLFSWLLDQYQYVIGVRRIGQVFLIRRSPDTLRAMARGEQDVQEVLLAGLIRDDEIAETLLATPLIPMHYEKERDPVEGKEEFKGAKFHQGRPQKETSGPYFDWIDFEGGKTITGNKTALARIRETWQAIEEGQKEAERQRIERERKEKEEAKRKQQIHLNRHKEKIRWSEEVRIRSEQEAEKERKALQGHALLDAEFSARVERDEIDEKGERKRKHTETETQYEQGSLFNLSPKDMIRRYRGD